jgi:hypothetical protein
MHAGFAAGSDACAGRRFPLLEIERAGDEGIGMIDRYATHQGDGTFVGGVGGLSWNPPHDLQFGRGGGFPTRQ